MRALPLLAAALALAAGACAAPPAEKSAGGEREAARAGQPWWKLSQYSRKPAVLSPREMQERRPGLFSGKDGEFVLYRKGEADSSDPTKPSKIRR